jgi:glycosyltransferase involved in cell wall biosynthesis
MVEAPWFAATMTVRNNADTIRDAVASIAPDLEQGGELTVVDAESTDGTWPILVSVGEHNPRIRVRQVACNRGTGRNLAVGMSRAPVVLTTIDADNRYAPGVLARVAAAVRDSPRWDMLMAIGLEDRDPSSSRFYAWKRERLLEVGGFPDTQYMEEDGLLLRALRRPLRVGRFAAEHVAEDLKARPAHHLPNVPVWRRYGHTVRAARKFQWFGFRFPEYARFLWMTRRGPARFGAGFTLSAYGYLRGAASRDPTGFAKPTDFDYGVVQESPFSNSPPNGGTGPQ